MCKCEWKDEGLSLSFVTVIERVFVYVCVCGRVCTCVTGKGFLLGGKKREQRITSGATGRVERYCG